MRPSEKTGIGRTRDVTLDSSVIVSALLKGDEHNSVAREVMKQVFVGRFRPNTSTTVPVEVCGAISRRAGADKGLLARKQLLKWETLNLIAYTELSGRRMDEAMEISVKQRVRGMDAIVAQVAKERQSVLITFDLEMAERIKPVVSVLTHEDF